MSCPPLNSHSSSGSYSSSSLSSSMHEDEQSSVFELPAKIQDQVEKVYAKCFTIIEKHNTGLDYFALHGQSISVMVFGDLIKQLEILKNPKSSYKHFKFFRIPNNERYESVQAFFDKHLFDEKADAPYDHFYSDKLLSIDLCYENRESDESAYDFMTYNRSIMLEAEEGEEELSSKKLSTAQHPKMISIAEDLLKFYGVNEKKTSFYLNRIQELITEVENNNTVEGDGDQFYQGVGNLYLMLLPKTLLDEEQQGFAYLSMEGGVLYDPADHKLSREQLLEGLQTLDHEIMQKYKGVDCTFFPQGRIICSALTPETGVRIFKLNALTDDFKAKYKEKIKDLAKKIFTESLTLRLVLPRRY